MIDSFQVIKDTH